MPEIEVFIFCLMSNLKLKIVFYYMIILGVYSCSCFIPKHPAS